MESKILTAFFICLILLSPTLLSDDPIQPIGVAGYITFNDEPYEDKQVFIENKVLGETSIVTTDENGLFFSTISGRDGDNISISVGLFENETNANLSLMTNWLNLSILEISEGESWEGWSGRKDEDVWIPKPIKTKYDDGPIQTMYDLLRVTHVPDSYETVSVLVIDSGISKWVKTYESEDGTIVNFSEIEQYGESPLHDTYGHGTFVNYEIAWLLQKKCKNANQISYKCFKRNGGASDDQFMNALKFAEREKPDIVSISAGAEGNINDAYSKQVERLRSMGIIVVVAAGNSGPVHSSILSPAVSDAAICVGAFDWMQTFDNWSFKDDIVCQWSSRGPVVGIRPKPDCVAPGESLAGPWLSGDELGRGNRKVQSGTSMAAPLISGGASLVVANNRGLVDIVKTLYFFNKGIVPQSFEDALKESCKNMGDENSWGAGIPAFDEVNILFHQKLLFSIIIYFIVSLLIAILGLIIFIKKEYLSEKVRRWMT